jgi:hypothetical protein
MKIAAQTTQTRMILTGVETYRQVALIRRLLDRACGDELEHSRTGYWMDVTLPRSKALWFQEMVERAAKRPWFM